jgi:hypothetical protein
LQVGSEVVGANDQINEHFKEEREDDPFGNIKDRLFVSIKRIQFIPGSKNRN